MKVISTKQVTRVLHHKTTMNYFFVRFKPLSMSLKTRWAGKHSEQAIFGLLSIQSFIPVKVDLSGADDNLQHFSYLHWAEARKKMPESMRPLLNYHSTYIEEFHFHPSKRITEVKKCCYFSYSDIFLMILIQATLTLNQKWCFFLSSRLFIIHVSIGSYK